MRPNDKRLAARERHDSVLEIFDASGKLIAWTGKLVDFSETGARFSSDLLMEPGEKIEARLRLLSKGVLEISAHVVWRRKNGRNNLYGIAFDSIRNIYPTGELKKPLCDGPQ